MKRLMARSRTVCAILMLVIASSAVHAQIASNKAEKSPWGPDDEIGTLNMMADASRFNVLRQVTGGKVYDLGVDLFVGMPLCCTPFGDPSFLIWMTHTPARDSASELLSYSGDAISMYTHSGTHLDTLNHFGLHGQIWNQVSADDALGVRGWTKSGADKYPPIVARGVLIDVAGSKNLAHLPTSYAITVADLQAALKKQGTTLRPGDVVLTRTGLMTLWPDVAKYRFADNFGVEFFPSKDRENFVPVHTFLFAERGVSILEAMWLEDLAKDQVYEFLFIGSPLKIRGATASPLRPLAIPIRRR